MPYADTQLLCTFSTSISHQKEIDALNKFYTINDGKVYILQNTQDTSDVALTYNAQRTSERYARTISVHRKKDYNVLYSINALNELVKLENGGIYTPNYDIKWDKYRNSIITLKEGKLKITQTKLLSIYRI